MRWLFVPLIAGKPWSGNTVLSEPLGGSESAVAYLAQSLQRKGQEVSVITHGPAETDYCGVTYYNNAQGYIEVLNQEWDVVVSSRWPQIFDTPWKTRHRLLWLHDLPGQPFRAQCTAVIFISDFQRNAYGKSGRGVYVIGDGVPKELVDRIEPQERNENTLIWTSNPDRGAGIAAHILQELRKRWPELELHIYGRAAVYGWDSSAEAPHLPRESDMAGVVLHNPLPRAQLFKELAKAWCFFYPTHWPETYCMAALESQALGTPVIASPYAALNETVKGGILTYDFLNAISQLRNKRRWEKLSVAGIEWGAQNTWDSVADRWLEATDESEHRSPQ